MEGDIKAMGKLGIALLAFMILTGVFFLIGALWNESLCTQADSNYVWAGGECQLSSTNSTEASVDAITYVNIVIAAFVIALGFLSIVVLVGIAKILLRMIKGF